MKEKNNPAIGRLRRIQQVWKEIQEAEEKSPEYEKLVEQCRVLVAEYQKLVDAPKKPRKSS